MKSPKDITNTFEASVHNLDLVLREFGFLTEFCKVGNGVAHEVHVELQQVLIWKYSQSDIKTN